MDRWLTEDISAFPLQDGRYIVKNHKTGLERFMTKMQLADYLRENATSPDHIPIGDYVHQLLKAVGFSGCLSCAKRQVTLNRMISRKRT